MKKNLKSSILFVFLFIILSFYNNKVLASDLKMNDLIFNIRVNEDASMNVTEIWNIKIKDTNTLFKSFQKDKDKYTSITDVVVTNMETNTRLQEVYQYMYHVTNNCYYGLDIGNNEFEIAWGVGLENSSDTREYKIEYKVEDAVAIHGDCAELYWQLIGNDFKIPIENIEGTITLPSDNINKNEIRVWGHTKSLNGIINVTDNGIIEFTLENIPANNMVEIRTLFPKDIIFSSNRTDNNNVINYIIGEETAWADAANKEREIERNFQMLVLIGGIIVIGFVAGWQLIYIIKVFKNTKPKILPVIDVDYYRDLPREDATPAQAYTLIYKNTTGNSLDLGKVFAATLMDLNIKRFLSFEVSKDAKNNEIITIRLTENTQLNTLPEDEKQIYDFVKIAIDKRDDKQITIKQLQDYIQRSSSKIMKLKSNLGDAITKFLNDNEYLNQEDVKKKKSLDSTQNFCFFSSILSLLIFGGIFDAFNTQLGIYIHIAYMVIEIIISILCSLVKKKLNIFTQKGVDEIDKWKGLKKFMEDFSQIDKKDLPSIVIWEKYLVYATAFGIADKVIKQLKIVYPELEDNTYFLTHTYTTMYLATHTNFSSSFSSAVSSSISSAISSGSGGGGGFSGGGGRGGGGGGGGGR